VILGLHAINGLAIPGVTILLGCATKVY